MIGYYQIVNGLEVTGWVTEETYLSIQYNSQLKTEISKYLPSVGKLNAKELVDLIGSGIQFIQENKDNKVACDKAYAEIEILLKYLKKRPKYLNNKNLKDVDWIYKVGDDTPEFKDIVDVAFIITVGGAIAYEAITTGGVVLTVGSTIIPVAGYTAEQWTQAVDYAVKSVNSNSAHHILQEKHLWSNIVSNPTWGKISWYVQQTLLYGNENVLVNGYSVKEMMFKGCLVQVRYVIVKWVLTISDAWIKSN